MCSGAMFIGCTCTLHFIWPGNVAPELKVVLKWRDIYIKLKISVLVMPVVGGLEIQGRSLLNCRDHCILKYCFAIVSLTCTDYSGIMLCPCVVSVVN